MRLNASAVVMCVVLGAAVQTARAVEPDGSPVRAKASAGDRHTAERERAHVRALLEAGGIIGLNATWYWLHTNLNEEDWELNWDWQSWDAKLTTLEHVRFDTNYFSVNAVTHPVAGILYYQVGRGNGFSMLGATALNLSTAVLWEYIAEFKEAVSINDLIVNTTAGIGAAEPLVQIGRYFRRQRLTVVSGVLAFLFSPFETVHAAVDDGPYRSSGPEIWHRFRLGAGSGPTGFDDVSTFEHELALDLQVVAREGYGVPGRRAGWTDGGAWSRVQARLRFGREEPDSGLPGVRIDTSTTLVGHYAQDVDATGHGWGRFAGVGTGFLYETRRLAVDEDRLLIAHAAGPRLELAGYLGRLSVRWSLALYGDFALVQAHVFGPTLPFDDSPPFTTPLRRFGYYYGYGGTAVTRLLVEARPLALDLEVWGHAFASIDGRDRIELNGGPEDPHGIRDQRLYGRLELTAFPWDVGVGIALDGALRRGSWSDRTRQTVELRASGEVVLRF